MRTSLLLALLASLFAGQPGLGSPYPATRPLDPLLEKQYRDFSRKLKKKEAKLMFLRLIAVRNELETAEAEYYAEALGYEFYEANRFPDRLTELEVPHSAILNSKEVLEGELGQYHRVMAEADGPRGKFRTIRSPLHFDGEIEREITAPPELGQDNAEYLGGER